MLSSFRAACDQHGPPASTLTDNGLVYTTRFAGGRGGRNGLEHELRRLGTRQKNGRPNHPQTQGKIERFWQTLKKWLAARPRPATLAQLQTLLDTFTLYYDTRRPHRSLPHRQTPATAYAARPKATPGDRTADIHDRVRTDIIGITGTVTLRTGGRLYHIGVGRTHARTRVLLLIRDLDIRVINAATGELLRQLHPRPRPQLPAHRPPARTRTRNTPQTQRPRTLTWVQGYSDVPRDHTGAPGRTRTCDRLLRRQLLYPAELQAPTGILCPRQVTRRTRLYCGGRCAGPPYCLSSCLMPRCRTLTSPCPDPGREAGPAVNGALLVAGTTSDAGKSVIVAGIVRWLHREGVRVAPFKAQNMSLNSFVTVDGAEIGRAQAMQAAAAGLEPDARMNPVLLKPGHNGSQVVVLGQPIGEVDAAEYADHADRLLDVAEDSLAQLRRDYDVVICEGAGSPAEINLRATDIANMGIARAAGLPVVLVTDIDRGGSFAALHGTVALLAPEDQALVSGFIINKFRGDRALLEPGLGMLRGLTGRPVLGVLPWADGLWLDAEDSLSLSTAVRPPAGPPAGHDVLRVSVVRLPRISNFTDIDALSAEPGVLVRVADTAAELADADLVIIPGTRATVADLSWLRDRGMAEAIAARARSGQPVLGICGGYQMLASQIADDVESGAGQVSGLGLLPATRHLRRDEDPRPADGLGLRRRGVRLRDPPRRRVGFRHHRGAVPRWLPQRHGLGHQLARHAGERRVPARVPDRSRRAGRARLQAGAGHLLRRAPAGGVRPAR